MAIRTIVDSVERVDGRVPDHLQLEHALEELRKRHPGAIFSRYLDKLPTVAEGVWIAPGAAIVGDVELREHSSVWFGCVLRGDVNHIRLGARSNLQDGVVVHLGDQDPTIIDEDVVVGHRAVLHGCHVEPRCLIGISATVLDGAIIGEGSIVGAGALVTAGTKIPSRSLVLGTPAKVVRELPENAPEFHAQLAAKYTRLSHNYLVG
jgi:carbonic anhydrase/acetyltransferase-like protein (isoleucine patch superfamily)